MKKIKTYHIILFLLVCVVLTCIISPLSQLQQYKIYQIHTQSMMPVIQPSSIVVVAQQQTYNVGDIVAYKHKNNKIIVHRLLELNTNTALTKGDNNAIIDDPFPRSAIIGKVTHIFPLQQIIVYACLICIGLFIFAYISKIILGVLLHEKNNQTTL